MALKEFVGKGLVAKTRRIRNFRIKALGEAECHMKLTKMGFLVPAYAEEVPPEPATKAQKILAQEFGLCFPEDISKSDMAYLLDKFLERDEEPNPDLLCYADTREICPSDYIGKRALYNHIFAALRGVDKVAFFLFCLYCDHCDEPCGNLDDHPSYKVFYSLAKELESDPAFVDSVEYYPGESLQFFGQVTVQNVTYTGGNTETLAYRRAIQALQRHFPIDSKGKQELNEEQLLRIASHRVW